MLEQPATIFSVPDYEPQFPEGIEEEKLPEIAKIRVRVFEPRKEMVLKDSDAESMLRVYVTREGDLGELAGAKILASFDGGESYIYFGTLTSFTVMGNLEKDLPGFPYQGFDIKNKLKVKLTNSLYESESLPLDELLEKPYQEVYVKQFLKSIPKEMSLFG